MKMVKVKRIADGVVINVQENVVADYIGTGKYEMYKEQPKTDEKKATK